VTRDLPVANIHAHALHLIACSDSLAAALTHLHQRVPVARDSAARPFTTESFAVADMMQPKVASAAGVLCGHSVHSSKLKQLCMAASQGLVVNAFSFARIVPLVLYVVFSKLAATPRAKARLWAAQLIYYGVRCAARTACAVRGRAVPPGGWRNACCSRRCKAVGHLSATPAALHAGLATCRRHAMQVCVRHTGTTARFRPCLHLSHCMGCAACLCQPYIICTNGAMPRTR
jgi:hypothetical protein